MFHTFHEQVSPMEVPRIGNDATEVVLTHVLSRSLSDRMRGVSDSLHPNRPLSSSAHRAPLSRFQTLVPTSTLGLGVHQVWHAIKGRWHNDKASHISKNQVVGIESQYRRKCYKES